jgi:hypothetical protein
MKKKFVSRAAIFPLSEPRFFFVCLCANFEEMTEIAQFAEKERHSLHPTAWVHSPFGRLGITQSYPTRIAQSTQETKRSAANSRLTEWEIGCLAVSFFVTAWNLRRAHALDAARRNAEARNFHRVKRICSGASA